MAGQTGQKTRATGKLGFSFSPSIFHCVIRGPIASSRSRNHRSARIVTVIRSPLSSPFRPTLRSSKRRRHSARDHHHCRHFVTPLRPSQASVHPLCITSHSSTNAFIAPSPLSSNGNSNSPSFGTSSDDRPENNSSSNSSRSVKISVRSTGVVDSEMSLRYHLKRHPRLTVSVHNSPPSLSGLFSNAIFRDIVISLAATIGLYVISSVIHVRGLSFEVHESASIFPPPLDGPVAHGYLVRAVHAPCTLIHQHSERLRCESHACLPSY